MEKIKSSDIHKAVGGKSGRELIKAREVCACASVDQEAGNKVKTMKKEKGY